MKDLNRLVIIGNVSKAPEDLKQTAAGDNFITFHISASHVYKKWDQEAREKLEIEVFAWNWLAKWISENVKKGNRLYVEGRLKLKQKSYYDLGVNVMPELVAEQIIPTGAYGNAPKWGNQIEPNRKAPELSEDGDKF